jgi:hypothetical protein
MDKNCGNCYFSDESSASVRGVEGVTACKEAGPAVFLNKSNQLVSAFPPMEIRESGCRQWKPAVGAIEAAGNNSISLLEAWTSELNLTCSQCDKPVHFGAEMEKGDTYMQCDGTVEAVAHDSSVPPQWKIAG